VKNRKFQLKTLGAGPLRQPGRKIARRAGGLLILALLPALLLAASPGRGQNLLIPMDETQRDHLKAYGLTYWALQSPRGFQAEWLLNYRGGAFVIMEAPQTRRQADLVGVSYEVLPESRLQALHELILEENMETVVLEKPPKVAVYAPPDKDPWDDAVMLALDYADIPYDQIWDPDVLAGRTFSYDWVHLHHEDFTGQFGKFYGNYHGAPWYKQKVRRFTEAARQAGFSTVSAHKLAVAKAFVEYIRAGGFLFAMCSATDTLDIALAAEGLDIIPHPIDGSPMTPGFQAKLNFSRTLVFQNFRCSTDAFEYEHSDIDVKVPNTTLSSGEYFTLFDFSAKIDTVPAMLVQCHTSRIKEFRGQTTAFRRDKVKDSVVILAKGPGPGVVKYVHGNFGQGTFTFLAGHDPEDYAHLVGEEPTELSLHKNSPGYRLILNNILFPAAKKRDRRT